MADKKITKKTYIKDLEGCEFYFLGLGIVGCYNGILYRDGKPAWIYAENSNRKITFNLHKRPKCWAEACWLSNATGEWLGIEEVSLKESGRILVKMYS